MKCFITNKICISLIYLVTGFEGYGVSLAGILCHQGVNVVDDITANRGGEDRL